MFDERAEIPSFPWLVPVAEAEAEEAEAAEAEAGPPSPDPDPDPESVAEFADDDETEEAYGVVGESV